MIVVTYQMEKTVNHNAAEFRGKLSSVKRRVLADRVDTYEKISGENIAFHIIESNDIGIVVVSQIIDIHIQDVRVGAKNYVNIAYSLSFSFCDETEPAVVCKFALQVEFYAL